VFRLRNNVVVKSGANPPRGKASKRAKVVGGLFERAVTDYLSVPLWRGLYTAVDCTAVACTAVECS
jgi:hypothetical protein